MRTLHTRTRQAKALKGFQRAGAPCQKARLVQTHKDPAKTACHYFKSLSQILINSTNTKPQHRHFVQGLFHTKGVLKYANI